ncbi:MAG: multicopper oxidase family protein [Ancrocorticia sp.]|uniref:multicopper oxidase family protein n=1 Tax=Ancrocorticia sp. TaxID=2593684 RepID=UPI003F934A23
MSTTTKYSGHTFDTPAAGGSTQSEQRNRSLAETGRLALPALSQATQVATTTPPALSVAPAALPGSPSTLGLRKFRDPLTQPDTIRTQDLPEETAVTIRALPTKVQFHADLPETIAWAYEGSIPGPTIEARRAHTARIDWENALKTEAGMPLPYDVVRVPPQATVPETLRIANSPGGRVLPDHTTHGAPPSNAYPRLPDTDAIRAANVVHLHGSLTDGHNDGWAHNVMMPGHTARCTYPNHQESATLWYHDHTMAITRFTVHAGLAGFYLIRDEIEDSLGLPSGERELVLAIADRNLESEPGEPSSFIPTGRLLYKQAGVGTDEAATEIPQTGPFTMVNGKIWPTHAAEPAWHRLRIVNGSNARIYRLALYDTTDEEIPADAGPLPSNPDGGFGEDTSAYGMHRLDSGLVIIGTDTGLLPEPVIAPAGSIELGPGERLDILVNLGAHTGRTLELRNESATALRPQPGQIDATIMQFSVGASSCEDEFVLPKVLTPAYNRWEQNPDGSVTVGNKTITDYQDVWLAVIPTNVHNNGHPQLWEMEDVTGTPPDELDTIDVIRLERPNGEEPLVLRAHAKLFDDTVGILIAEGSWAKWNVVHLGGPEHPMHIHMTAFQMIERGSWTLNDGGTVPGFDPATGSTPNPLPLPADGPEITPVEAGTKDTWVVGAGEVVSFFGHFEGACGEFMYHCHILDHEDHTMMRPFVVLPPDVLALHGGHGGPHPAPHHG